MNEALVFRHFPSKEELYWAVIERKISSAGPRERLRENLEIGGDDLVIFARLAAEILERRANDQTLSRLLLFSALENHRLSHHFFRTYVAEYYDMLADFIRKRIEEGRFRDVDPLLAARGFLGMVIYHSWVQELFGGRRFQDFNVQQVSHTLAKIWLQGMLAETKIAPQNHVTKSKNGSSRNHSRK